MPTKPARYWIGTCYCDGRPSNLPEQCAYIKGQQEECPSTMRLHWQLIGSLANRNDCPLVEASSAHAIGNPPDLKRQKLMCGRKTRGSLVPNSSLEAARFNATLRRIGIKYDNMLKEESLSLYPVTYMFGTKRLMVDIIAPSPLSLQIIPELLETKKRWWYFTEELGVESLGELGTRQVWKLTLKIHDPSGGMATGVKKMLLSMNFEELSTFHTFLDGSTVIRCVLNEKDHLSLSELKSSGLLQTLVQTNGIPDLIVPL